jgi:hypothetical protein
MAASETDRPSQPPAADYDSVREALKLANERYSIKEIFRAAEKAGCKLPISQDALRRYANGTTAHTGRASRAQLEKFLFHTPIGNKMRTAPTSSRSSCDRLTDVLSTGEHTKPASSDVTGLYFAYHGSYLAEKCFAIRLVEIALHGTQLSVADYIREKASGPARTHLAHGGAVFFGNPPRLHIVTGAEENDNRQGLALFVGTSPVFSETHRLMEVTGALVGMTKGGHHFYRQCILVSAASGQEADESRRIKLIEQTGVFAPEKLAKLPRRHRLAIDTLTDRLQLSPNKETFSDPIVGLIGGLAHAKVVKMTVAAAEP